MRTRTRGIDKALMIGILAAAVCGCAATVRTRGIAVVHGFPVVQAEVVPSNIAAYPRIYYHGAYAYLVGGRWYYPTAQGWMVFREEPVELGRYRTELQRRPRVRTAPPPPVYSYPPPR